MAKILVVDDEEINLNIVCSLFAHEGYQVLFAKNGAQAWNSLKNVPKGAINVIIVDRIMPGMDGVELVSQIRADAELKSLPIIMLTAKTTEEDILDGLNAGADYYVTKPFDTDQLLANVKSAVSGSK